MHLVQKEPDTKLVYSTVVGESIPFVIGDSSVIIDIIRKKIYSYPLRTMVQEYLSNARDSQMEAGNDPSEIEVFLPTTLKPEFSIRDYGVGMSDERVREVFVQYGISTKRKSNSQLGYFGIGSKSGWAYTDSFIVESFYDGIHRAYIADIGDNKEGRLLLHSEKPTDERNGVLIKIPVNPNDIYQFMSAYVRTTCFWEKKPKLLHKTDIVYPELLYDIDDVRIYKLNRTMTFDSGICFNAAGIPFNNTSSIIEVLNSGDTPSSLLSFFSSHNVMVVIDVDPALLGISANRETYSNKKYAEKKIRLGSDKIFEHINGRFESCEAKDYIKVFKSLNILSDLARISIFSKKEYTLSNGHSNSADIYINKGHFSLISHGIKYPNSVKKRLSLIDTKAIFLSSSKIILTKNAGGSLNAPEFEAATRKALSIARRIELFGQNRDRSYIFFQEDLTDSEYTEIAAVIGATEYLEDIFKDVKPPKLPKVESTREPDKIYVYPYEIPARYKSSATRSRTSRILDESFIKDNKVIFYGPECSRNLLYFLTRIPHHKACAVYGPPSTLEKIKLLNNPKLLPIEKVAEYIKGEPDILADIINQRIVMSDRSTWRFLDRAILYLTSQKYNLKKLSATANYYMKYYNDNSDFGNVLGNIELKSELSDFLDTYPLLPMLSGYSDLSTKQYEHINFYIKSIDEGLLQ